LHQRIFHGLFKREAGPFPKSGDDPNIYQALDGNPDLGF